MNDTTKEVLTAQELETLEYTSRIRKEMVGSLTKNMEAIDFETAEVANKVLDSIDKGVYTQSQLRLKHAENQNTEAITANVVALLKQVSAAKEKNAVQNYNPELPDASVPTDFVPGENVIDDSPLDPNQFIVSPKEFVHNPEGIMDVELEEEEE